MKIHNKTKMRVFIGIKVSDKFRSEVLNWQNKNNKLPVRFVKPENLHITLVPPWYDNNIEKLVKQLKKFRADIHPFKVSFQRIITAPLNRPRLIWTEAETPPEIVKLKMELCEYLKIGREKRKFKTHITIARFKEKDISLIGKITEIVNFGPLEVNEFTLFESKLLRSGAEYFHISNFAF